MPREIEQVTPDGQVLLGLDNVLKAPAIRSLLARQDGLELTSRSNPYSADFKGTPVVLCVKNITYLGTPHPIFKKRIQISARYQRLLAEDSTFLLGVYSHQGATTFCLFDTGTYRNNRLNNSSAHVSVLDLRKAREQGIFEKVDMRGNRIVVFAEHCFEEAFDSYVLGKELALPAEVEMVKRFFESVPRRLVGIDSIREMLKAGDPKALEAEWAGFFVEHLFKRFLDDHPGYSKHCVFIHDKAPGGMDLDLLFLKGGFPGDLKTHTRSNAIQGNDKATIEQAVERCGKVWYIVLEHNTVRDKDMGGVTCIEWNEQINERNRRAGRLEVKERSSYLSRMKHSVQFVHFLILEITAENYMHVGVYNQGRNSDGSRRMPKIMIRRKDIDNFAIFKLDPEGCEDQGC